MTGILVKKRLVREWEWREGQSARESFLALLRLVAPKSSTVACCWREGLVKGAHG